MRQLLIFLVGFLLSQLSYSQQPGSKIDFGTYNKNYQFKSGNLTGVGLSSEGPIFKKLPNWGNWTKVDPNNLSKSAELIGHPSKTFLGEIASFSINGEFISKDTSSLESSFIEMYCSDYVTNADWNLFQEYVKDSIVRTLLASEYEEEYLMYKDPDDESKNLLNWEANINWKVKEENQKFETFAQIFYPEYERYYRKLEIDSRKLKYQYEWLNEDCINSGERDLRRCFYIERVPLFRDSTFWINDTTFNHFSNVEDGLVQFYNSHDYFKNSPVTSITSAQAKAFLQWKQTCHQKALNSQNINLFVKYDLPHGTLDVQNESPVVEIQEFSLSHWQITNADYLGFVNYVRDSIARRILSEEVDLDYLTMTINSYDLHIDEESMWNVNWKRKIDWKRKTAIPFKGFVDGKTQKVIPEYGVLNSMFYPIYEVSRDTNTLDKRKLILAQYFYDFKTASLELPKIKGNQQQIKWSENCDQNKVYITNQIPEFDAYRGLDRAELGKDLDLSTWNGFCETSDVHSHQDRSRFIIQDILSVYPTVKHREVNMVCLKDNVSEEDFWYGERDSVSVCKMANCEECPQYWDWESVPDEYDFTSQPKALIKEISYYQFVAYWRWRIHEKRPAFKCANPVVSNYIPSKEEFYKIQNGEKISHQAESHVIPTPTFRCSISFFNGERSFK